MHPIEHLRYVARARGADAPSLVAETAHALGSLRFDPSSLVVACRRVVERHPVTGPLWWLCANVVTSAEPFDTVWELAEEVHRDTTASRLAEQLPDDATVVTIGDPDALVAGLAPRGDIRVLAADVHHVGSAFVRRLERADVEFEPIDAGALGVAARHADLVLVEVLAVDTQRAVAPIGSSTLAATAAAWDTPVWMVAGVGRRLPSGFLDAMEAGLVAATTDTDPWELDAEVVPNRLFTDVVGPLGRVPMGPPAIVAECPFAPELLRHSAI